MTNDPLDDIFVRTEEVNQEQRALLAKHIFPYASVNPETGDVYFKATADELNAKQRILVYLLCRLALSSIPNTTFSKAVSPLEVQKGTDLPGGTVRPKLMQLVEDKIAARTGGGYQIPAAYLYRVNAMMPPLD